MAEAETTFSKVIPPPVAGWNTKDPISQMDPLYSPGIENYLPGGGVVDLRRGNRKHVLTSATSLVFNTLAELVTNAGDHFLVAFAPLAAYNVTSAGAGTDISGAAAGSIGSIMYTTVFRGRLFAKSLSGSSDIAVWTGSGNFALAAFTGPSGNDQDLWRLASYKNRLYALAISDASMWYGGFEAITGAMTQYDFQSVLTLGGQPWYIGPFSMTGGDITQEYFAVISEQGEVLLYQGDYPGSANWSLVGHYFLPAPVGQRSFFNWRSDILIITFDGLVSLREYIGTPVGQDYRYLSDNISTAYRDIVEATSANIDLSSGIVYPRGLYLLINFISGVEFPYTCTQFVMNTQTRAWTKFTGQNAKHFSLLNNELYWCSEATSTKALVMKSDTGYYDEDPDTSAVVTRTTKLRFAFNYLDQPNQVKIVTECVPIVYESENLAITLNADVDYSDTAATSSNTTTGDTSYKLYSNVICGLKADPGKAVSIRLNDSVTTKRRSIQAVEVRWKEGGIR